MKKIFFLLLLFLPIVSAIDSNHITGCWDFDSGGQDSSPNALDFKPNGILYHVPGYVINAVNFSGDNESYVAASGVLLPGSKSISFMIESGDFSENDYECIIDSSGWNCINPVNNGFVVYKQNNSNISVKIMNTASSEYFDTSPDPLSLPDNGWSMITIVQNGSSGLLVYLNTTLMSADHVSSGTESLSLGNLTVGNSYKGENYSLHGRIDRLVIFDTAISEDDITELFNDGNVRSCFFLDYGITGDAVTIGSCPDSLNNTVLIICLTAFSIFMVFVSMIMRFPVLGFFSSLLMLVSSWYIAGCFAFFGYLFMLISILLIIWFPLSSVFSKKY